MAPAPRAPWWSRAGSGRVDRPTQSSVHNLWTNAVHSESCPCSAGSIVPLAGLEPALVRITDPVLFHTELQGRRWELEPW